MPIFPHSVQNSKICLEDDYVTQFTNTKCNNNNDDLILLFPLKHFGHLVKEDFYEERQKAMETFNLLNKNVCDIETKLFEKESIVANLENCLSKCDAELEASLKKLALLKKQKKINKHEKENLKCEIAQLNCEQRSEPITECSKSKDIDFHWIKKLSVERELYQQNMQQILDKKEKLQNHRQKLEEELLLIKTQLLSKKSELHVNRELFEGEPSECLNHIKDIPKNKLLKELNFKSINSLQNKEQKVLLTTNTFDSSQETYDFPSHEINIDQNESSCLSLKDELVLYAKEDNDEGLLCVDKDVSCSNIGTDHLSNGTKCGKRNRSIEAKSTYWYNKVIYLKKQINDLKTRINALESPRIECSKTFALKKSFCDETDLLLKQNTNNPECLIDSDFLKAKNAGKSIVKESKYFFKISYIVNIYDQIVFLLSCCLRSRHIS